jgi:hypothetical protein
MNEKMDLTRRGFLKNSACGITGAMLGSGVLFSRLSRAAHDSLKISKVDPVLLTGVRGYGPWLFELKPKMDSSVGAKVQTFQAYSRSPRRSRT